MTDDLRRDPAERIERDEPPIGSTPPHPSPAEGAPAGTDDAGASARPPRPSQAEGERREDDDAGSQGSQDSQDSRER